MKIHTTLTIDSEVMKKAKKLNINLSGTFNDYLKNVVAQSTGDLADINYELLCIDITRLSNRKLKLDSELHQKIQTKERIDDERHNREEEKLQMEKEKIESAKKCIGCGTILSEGHKVHNFTAGKVCNVCFFGADANKMKEWSNNG